MLLLVQTCSNLVEETCKCLSEVCDNSFVKNAKPCKEQVLLKEMHNQIKECEEQCSTGLVCIEFGQENIYIWKLYENPGHFIVAELVLWYYQLTEWSRWEVLSEAERTHNQAQTTGSC